MSSSSPEKDTTEALTGCSKVSGYAQGPSIDSHQISTALADLMTMFPDLDGDVLNSILQAQGGCAAAVVEYLMSGSSLDEVGRIIGGERQAEPAVDMVGEFSDEIGGLPEVLPSLCEKEDMEKKESDHDEQEEVESSELHNGGVVVVHEHLPLGETDRQALLKEAEGESLPMYEGDVDSSSGTSTRPSHYSRKGRVGDHDDEVSSNGEKEEMVGNMEAVSQTKKSKLCVPLLSCNLGQMVKPCIGKVIENFLLACVVSFVNPNEVQCLSLTHSHDVLHLLWSYNVHTVYVVNFCAIQCREKEKVALITKERCGQVQDCRRI